jgi:hypothetical protein
MPPIRNQPLNLTEQVIKTHNCQLTREAAYQLQAPLSTVQHRFHGHLR